MRSGKWNISLPTVQCVFGLSKDVAHGRQPRQRVVVVQKPKWSWNGQRNAVISPF